MNSKLRYRLSTATVAEKLIGINILVFVLFFLFRTMAFLFGGSADFVLEWLVFPDDVVQYLYRPWTIITYAFMHGGIWHLVANMLILYFSGIFFLDYFGPTKLLSFYFLGAIAGALVYMASYNFFPAFQETGRSYLIGASAAVMSILVGIATHIPHMRVRLLLLGSIKLWWIAAFLVVLDIVQIPISNPGGHLAHLGGAALGYLYASQLARGRNIASAFENLLDRLSGNHIKRKKPGKRANLKTVHKRNNSDSPTGNRKKEEQAKIDAILDKIGKSGYESLSKEEKEFLFNAGKE